MRSLEQYISFIQRVGFVFVSTTIVFLLYRQNSVGAAVLKGLGCQHIFYLLAKACAHSFNPTKIGDWRRSG